MIIDKQFLDFLPKQNKVEKFDCGEFGIIKVYMDLDYPSQKRNQLSRQLNQVDRRYGSVILSNPKIIVPAKPVNQKHKKKILDLIFNDQATHLVGFLQRQSISLMDQISKQGHAWTVLHYIAKNNSNKCIQICLKWLYQSDKSAYQNTLNRKNCEGDTPLMTACLHKSNSVIKTILEYGGADIYAINSKKLSAYQIALTAGNQQALQMLMKYELKVKRKNHINRQILSSPLPDIDTSSFRRIYQWLIDCISLSKSQSQIKPLKQTQTDRRMIKNKQQVQSIPQIDICWKQAEKMSQKKIPLFSSISKPFSIKQSNIIVSHLLIIFQTLAQHPQLLKRIIYSTDDKFYVKLGRKQSRIVWVDNLFPFFVETKEPLFLSLQDQLWPMVLQKALSQYYNGYFQPAKIPIQQIIDVITGNQSYILSLKDRNSDQQKQIAKSILLKIQSKNCILIVTPKPQCPLKAQQGRIECFSLLKILNDKFLINCPFTCNDQQKRDERSSRQMKLHQSHYSNPNCTTLWLDSKQFFDYFDEAIYCHTFNSATMKSTQVKVSTYQKRAYLLVKVKQISENDKFYLSFKKNNDSNITPIKCSGWNILGSSRQHVQKISCQILGNVQVMDISIPSQFLMMCEFQQPLEEQNHENMLHVICRHEQQINIQALDCTIGDLQFIECCKKYFKEHFQQFDAPIIQTVGNYTLAMAASQQPCYIPLPLALSEDNIVQGMYVQAEQKLEMFQYSNIYFAVLSDVEYEIAKNLKIMSYQPVKKDDQIEQDDTPMPQIESV